MKKNESVAHVMTAEPVSVSRHEPVSAARQLMEKKDLHHLPVTDGEMLVGILSTSDFLRVSFGEYGNQDARSLDAVLDHTYQLSDLMNAAPVTVDDGSSIRDAAELLVSNSFHSLPVVRDGRLIGIVTSTDLIRYLLEQY